MKTYNVKVEDLILVVDAAGCSISQSGALIFTDSSGKVSRVFNVGVWEESWLITN